jgi:hypothetical protein
VTWIKPASESTENRRDTRSPWEAAVALALHRMCRCGHVKVTHSHYRRGTDCASCDCARYRGGFVFAVSFRTALPTPTAVVPDDVYRAADPCVRRTRTAEAGEVARVPAARVLPPREPDRPNAPVAREQAEA